MTVSILINNFNYGRYVGAAIDSALAAGAASNRDTQVVVVDDGSTDDSASIINGYGDRITKVLKPNGGQASAFNAGFAASRGDVILLLDSDDLCFDDRVANVAAVLENHPMIGWCFHRLRRLEADGSMRAGVHVSHGGQSRLVDCQAEIRAGRLPTFAPATSGLCFRRSLLSRILPMPEGESVSISDHYLKFLAMALAPGYCLELPLGAIRVHGSNAFTSRADHHALAARIKIMTAYWMNDQHAGLEPLTDKLMGQGIGVASHAGSVPATCRALVQEYLASVPWKRRTMITLRSRYHASTLLKSVRDYLKPRAQVVTVPLQPPLKESAAERVDELAAATGAR